MNDKNDANGTSFSHLNNLFLEHYGARTSGPTLDEVIEEAYNNFKSTFHFTKLSSNNFLLTFVGYSIIEYTRYNEFLISYRLNGDLIYFDSDQMQWYSVPVKTMLGNYKNLGDVDVSFFDYLQDDDSNDSNTLGVDDSNNTRDIELYSFDQGSELSLELLGFDHNLLHSMGYLDCHDETMQIRDLKLRVDEDCTYTVSRNGCILAGFKNPDTAFQTGDAYTEVFIYDDTDIVIENCGDVSSVVIFRGYLTRPPYMEFK